MKTFMSQAFEDEMTAAWACYRDNRLDAAFRRAEQAHVIGQRYVLPHVRSHWLMLKIGVARRSQTEVWGQAIRIVLGALGSAVNIVPVGNTGGTDVSMFKRLPIAPDIARIIDGK